MPGSCDILFTLHAAPTVAHVDLPGFRLHPLKGQMKGFWAVTMKNPPHPGGVVFRQCIEPLSLSITDAAAQGVAHNTNTLSELVNAKRGISPEMAVRLSKVFGGTEEGWLAQQAQYDLAQVSRDRLKLKRLELV